MASYAASYTYLSVNGTETARDFRPDGGLLRALIQRTDERSLVHGTSVLQFWIAKSSHYFRPFLSPIVHHAKSGS
jgi:hypothetical protein